MPRKTGKKTYKKRVPRRRRVTRPKAHYVTSIPNQMKVKLKYQDVYSTGTLLSGTESYIRWKANDIYKPLHDGSGHQSMFRDQWYTLYHWARCIGFKMRITMINTSLNPVHVCMVNLQDSTAITYAQAVEMKFNKKAVVTSSKPITKTVTVFVDRFLGNKKGTALSDDQFKQGPSTALDVKSCCWTHILFHNYTSVSTELLINYEVLQICVFSEPIIQALS